MSNTDSPVSRGGMKAWLEGHADLLQSFQTKAGATLEERLDKSLAFYKVLHQHGIAQRGWPESVGGIGGDALDRAELYDAFTATGYDMPEQVAALEVLAPALVKFAPEIAARHLPEILSGEAIWCQGFSEPEAGSDLASLRATATRDGDSWVISGQKVWTSLAHRAKWCAVLARTGERGSRHRGLTLFWVDLSSPGVTVRPLDSLTGEPEFSEIFLDEVRVGSDSVIGEVDSGWAVAMYLLQYERGMWAWQRQARMHAMLEDFIDNGSGPLDEHADAFGQAFTALAALRMRSGQSVARLSNDEVLGPEVSVDKIMLSAAEQLVNDTIVQAKPNAFAFGGDDSDDAMRSEWFYSRAASIYGGAVEIQKGILADRVLKLPREAS